MNCHQHLAVILQLWYGLLPGMCISLFGPVQEEDFLMGDVEAIAYGIVCSIIPMQILMLRQVLGNGFWLRPGVEEMAAELSNRGSLWRGQRLFEGLRFIYGIDGSHLE